MRLRIPALAAVLAATLLSPAPAQATPCTDAVDEAIEIDLGGGATGRFALPSTQPTRLVVFAHGYGHASPSWVEHLKATASHGAVGVAMDYRGTVPLADGYRGWPVRAGAEDLVAAARHFLASCSFITTTVLFGVSFGGNVSGYALALGEQDTGGSDPLFDWWIDVEGVANVTETYLEASAVAPVNAFAQRAKEDIETEMGGTILEQPAAYLERTVVARTPDIVAAGLRGAILVHGVDDGLVPYNQSREMTAALVASGLDTDMFTVLRRGAGEPGTTLSGAVLGPLFTGLGLGAYESPLAGHGSERSQTHLVITTAFDRLWALLDGNGPGPYREFVVDGEAGVIPKP